MLATPRIVVTGPPASGKTLARETIVAWLARAGGDGGVVEVSVDRILRERHLPGEASPDRFGYEADGALVLHRPAEQIPAAVREAIRRCEAAGEGFVLELATNECRQLVREAGALLAGTLVIGMSAPADTRAKRNAGRGAARIPDERLRGYPDELPEEVAAALQRTGARIVTVDGGVSRELVRTGIVSVLEAGFLTARPPSRR